MHSSDSSPAPTPTEVLRLLWRVDHALGRLSRQMLSSLGVTSPQRVALRALLLEPDTTAASLADALSVDRSSVTGILNRLQDAGLVERGPDDTDGRKHRIRVTEAGRDVDSLEHGTVEAAMLRALSPLAPHEIDVVTHFLVTFSTELERERDVLLRPSRAN